jgi:hypothetical protein
MRTLIKLVVVLVVCLVGIGFWQGWFSISRSPNSEADGDKATVNVSVDKSKMKSDVTKAEEKVKEKLHKLEGKVEGKATEAKPTK